MKVLGKTLACKYLSIYTVCLNHKAGAAGYATDPLCLSSRLKRPSKGEQGPRHFNPCCFAFPRCGSVPMFAGRGPSCRVPGRALTLPAASAAPWEPQHVTGQKKPGEMEWGGGLGLAPLSAPCQGISMCRGTCRKGTPRGRASPHQNCRSQWEESGGNNISGTESSFLGHQFISLNLAPFLLTYASPLFIPLS